MERSYLIADKKYSNTKITAGLRLSSADVDGDPTPEELFALATEALFIQVKADLQEHLDAGVAEDPKHLQSLIDTY